MGKSLIENAYEILGAKKDSLSFKDLWVAVVKQSGISEEEANARISIFYTNLSLDGRFVNLGDNVWDLKSRHTLASVHIDLDAVYKEEEASVNDDDDKEESEEANEERKSFETPEYKPSETEGFGVEEETEENKEEVK